MEFEWLVIITNTLVSIGLFTATLYRIKIEKDHVKTIVENANAAKKLELLKKAVEKEKDIILGMKNGEEMYDMLKSLLSELN